ncbi:MAG: DNA ligase D [Bacteroidetes bacterium]|nr:DNA ligase D [Bacteroidota bacterium]
MQLDSYNKKRNFFKTIEPKGRIKSPASKLSFVVQRHKASHLHYDFRLELDGTLKSWAVPKGPSLNPHDKRLAMMVEDHPYDYKNFKGIIPEGNYGAGIVEIWDTGYYSDLNNSDKKTAENQLREGLRKGNLKFKLYGKKLKGEFALVKLKGKESNAWLLIKHNDAYALHKEYSSETYTPKSSPINKWLQLHSKSVKKKVKAFPLPVESKKLSDYIKPMLAKETEKPFDDKDWLYEIKWDGYRTIAELKDGNIQLYSRNGITFNSSYPLVIKELKKININAVLDGEIVVMDEDGNPNFQLLQDHENNRKYAICYYVFDILFLAGKNICSSPLWERKKLLKKIIKKNDVVKYSDHISEKGKDFFNVAMKRNLEGIVAKKADSEYYPGKRTKEWLKIKNHKSQDAIIAGFTKPTGSRKHFGALVLGVLDGSSLKYIGHTGSGFDNQLLKEVSDLLTPLIRDTSPFDKTVKTNRPVTWVKPVLVCEIKYSEWTKDGIMRHPIFLRLRPDKSPKETTLQVPQEAIPASGEEEDKIYSFGNIRVQTTHTNKIFWPEEGITKGDVINYYMSISDYILPYLINRPQSLKRNPNGIKDNGFFHKDAGHEAPPWVKSFEIFSESANKDIDYILCNNKATLTYMNNLGCIEINPWHSTISALNKPDYLIIDIDPSDKNNFEQVIEVANVIHDILEKRKITNFCKTSGATGMHIYIPMGKKYDYDQVKYFAQIICIIANEQLPAFTSIERNLQKRGEKIYLDHLQNRRGQTIASVYSLRPIAGATVSTPLKWSEVKPTLSPKQFDIYTLPQRLKKTGDIFSGILGTGIDLKKCLKQLDK